jgi:cytoskeletal protein CcmA (bactofilin family)
MKIPLIIIVLITTSQAVLASECKRHSNGKGQICGAARVDPSVYVGASSKVSGNIIISENVKIEDSNIQGSNSNQEASGIWGNTTIKNASLSGLYKISGDVKIKEGTTIDGSVKIWGEVEVSKAIITGKVTISGKSKIRGRCLKNINCIKLNGNDEGINIYGNIIIQDEVSISDQVIFAGKAKAMGKAQFKNRAQIFAGTFEDNVQLSDSAYVWGNQTHLKGKTKVAGRYNLFNIKTSFESFYSKETQFNKDIFTPLSDKLLDQLNKSAKLGKSSSKSISIKYDLDGKKLKSISKAEAVKLLEDLVKTFSTRLENTNDGCFLRAHIASLEADKSGIQTSKIVIFTPHAMKDPIFKEQATQSRLLRFKSDEKDHKWVSHYSNLVFIKDMDGYEAPYVLDPAMSMKPMTLKLWTQMVTKETMPNDKNILLSFIIMPKQIHDLFSYLREDTTYEIIYNREAKTKTLLKLLDEISRESSMMIENFK